MPLRPERTERQTASRWLPVEAISPMPVITTGGVDCLERSKTGSTLLADFLVDYGLVAILRRVCDPGSNAAVFTLLIRRFSQIKHRQNPGASSTTGRIARRRGVLPRAKLAGPRAQPGARVRATKTAERDAAPPLVPLRIGRSATRTCRSSTLPSSRPSTCRRPRRRPSSRRPTRCGRRRGCRGTASGSDRPRPSLPSRVPA